MERRRRLQEIQEKLRQQAAELRAQREKEMMDTLEELKNSALKSLLDGRLFHLNCYITLYSHYLQCESKRTTNRGLFLLTHCVH